MSDSTSEAIDALTAVVTEAVTNLAIATSTTVDHLVKIDVVYNSLPVEVTRYAESV